jgi:hypothetical protein
LISNSHASFLLAFNSHDFQNMTPSVQILLIWGISSSFPYFSPFQKIYIFLTLASLSGVHSFCGGVVITTKLRLNIRLSAGAYCKRLAPIVSHSCSCLLKDDTNTILGQFMLSLLCCWFDNQHIDGLYCISAYLGV